jgi:hypothetical protein
VLKKTSASFGLVVATAAGILLSGAPAQAQNNSISGCTSCHSSRIRHHSSNFNGNRTRPRIFLRIFIYNRNNNVAVARNGQRQRQRERQQQFQRERRRRRGPGPQMLGAPQDLRGRGVLAPAPLTGPARTRSAPVNEPVNAVPQINQSAPRTDPRDNGQISRNGVIHPIQNTDSQQNRPGAEEAGQNGIKANPGINDQDRDISSWLNPALS